MAVTLNKVALRAATALIRAGHYDMASAWSLSAEEEDKLLGDSGKDWDGYAKWFLGEDDAENANTKAHYRYPYGKDGKVYRRAVAAIRSRSKQQGDEEIFNAAGELMTAMDDEEEKQQAAEEPGAQDDDRAVAATLQRVVDGLERIERRFGQEAPVRLRQVLGRAAMEHATIDPAERTIDMTVSSGAPVRRYDWQKQREYQEVLVIHPDAIRMGRLNAGAPLLDSHNYWSGTQGMIGAVVPGSARIENGQLRAKAKFSGTPEGERAFQMAKEGTLRHVSVGYLTHAEEQDESTDPPTYRATDWEPHEVSAVAMPADPKAGFRSAPLPHPRVTGRSESMTTAEAAAEAVRTERDRANGIRALGTRLAAQGLDAALVDKHVADGTTLEQFRAIALDSIASAATPPIDGARGVIPAPAITGRFPQRQLTKRQQLGRLVRIYGAAKGDPARAERMAMSAEWDDGNRDWQKRALVAGIGASGGFMVPEEYYPEVIELLRNRAVVRKLGALQIPMEGGNLTMPRLQGGATAGYVGEATATNASQEQFGQVKFTERKLMAMVPVSNDLLKFASPQADEVVLNDMIAQIAVSEDAAFIRGSGTQYTPKGMRYWAPASNVLTSSGTGLTNFVADLEAMESALEGANVRMINPAIILNPRSKNAIKLLEATTGQFVFRDEMKDGTLDGYPFGVTNNVPKNLGNGSQTEWYLADMADAVIADVPGLEIAISTEAAYVDSTGTMQAAFSQDVTVLRAIERHDFGMRHDVSVAVMTAVAY